MTYIDAYGDLFEDEDVYSCVLEYLIDNCPHYADLREIDEEEYELDEIALRWERIMNI